VAGASGGGGEALANHQLDPNGYEVVIHSNVSKRGKLKWNSRYTVLIKPKGAQFAPHHNRTGSLFYFKHAKQFMKQASQNGGGSVSVDVARLFAPPVKGKEVPKELALQKCRVEGNCDDWSTPAGTFGFLVVDDKVRLCLELKIQFSRGCSTLLVQPSCFNSSLFIY
jgi:hypothetical protein